ncbi:MAG: hypothetical protein P4L36_04345 [Holophaga sp.]|nr:hypothetical protein [Holophaga sp.]
MEISFALSSPGPDRLVYGLPRWYRPFMALILVLLALGIRLGGVRPGPLAWTILMMAVLGGLYEDSWSFDAHLGRVAHRSGLCFMPRVMVLEFAAIERFRLIPLVAGTIPGSADERAENEAVLAGGRGDDHGHRRLRHRKPFLDLVIECAEGKRYLVDHLPARRSAGLRETGARLASLCAKPLAEG